MENLKPCPFCGGDAYEESYDRVIQIGCRKCNYHMSFNGVLQTKINTGVVGSYTIRSDGVKVPYEYYDSKAFEKAYKAWNGRRCDVDEVMKIINTATKEYDGLYTEEIDFFIDFLKKKFNEIEEE